MSILMSLFPMGGQGKTCPDCGCSMNGGECPECGYGSEDEGEDDGEMESEGASIQELMDLKDDLQRVMEKVNRLIVKSGD